MLRAFLVFFIGLNSGVTLAQCYKGNTVTCGIEISMLKATNDFRAQNGLRPLDYKPEFNWAARKWSESMAAVQKISHDGFPTLRNQTIILEFPASNVKAYGENVAYFWGGNPPDIGKYFVDLWIKSEGHRANMLYKWKSFGVGYAKDKRGAHYATQIFGF